MIGLDLTKAFDMANHQFLLDELASSNIKYKLGKTLKSWRKDRSQSVVIGDAKSTPRPANVSVIQGSCLIPVLWLVSINRLLTDLRHLGQTFTAFADDIILYRPIVSQGDMDKIQNSLRLVEAWSRTHGKEFLHAKSNYLRIWTQKHFKTTAQQ